MLLSAAGINDRMHLVHSLVSILGHFKENYKWKKDIKKGHKTSEEFILWLDDSRK